MVHILVKEPFLALRMLLFWEKKMIRAEMSPQRHRLLAVGDIHGCLEPLRRLLHMVQPKPQDAIVFLGDYVDRGPNSRGVVDFLLKFARLFPQSVFLKGNHEAMFLDYLQGGPKAPFLQNGGISTLASYTEGVPAAHLGFLRKLALYHETESHIFVHAGLRPGRPLAEQREEDLLWIRDEFLQSDYDWGKPIVFGHTPWPEPLLKENRLGIDTGAVYGRTLSCCDVKKRQCWSV
jgi:serine/threonine protein phosphatase 1